MVERATGEGPEERYADMASCLADLEAALEVEVARSGGSHGEATTVLDSVPSKRKILTTRRVSAAGVLLVLVATVGAASDHRSHRKQGKLFALGRARDALR